MIVPDINVLLYAYNRQAPQHEVARHWWETVLNSRELIGLPNEVPLGFIRIATNPRMGRLAITFDHAVSIVSVWLGSPNCRKLLPKEDHVAKVFDLMKKSEVSGQLTSDATLAVYAIEARATLCSNDSDFARFPELEWRNPLLPD
ncbi:MAG: TA system VapC family ribonuclease toxin [Verrucomicrobiota bacterium]